MERINYFRNESWGEHERLSVIKTVEEFNELARQITENDSQWFDRFIVLCKHYYKQEPVGGNLHIVLEDGNLEDRNVVWCEGLSFGRRDMEASDIASMMEMMTMAQRRKVYRNRQLYV